MRGADSKTGKVIEGTPEEIWKGYAEGSIDLINSDAVPVRNTVNGQVTYVTGKDVPDALKSGAFVPATREQAERQDYERQLEGTAYAIPAYLQRTAGTLTVGGFDAAAAAIGGEDTADAMKTVQDKHKIASTLGDVTGIGIGTGLTMGLGSSAVGAAGATGRGVLGSALSAPTTIGLGAERATLGLLGRAGVTGETLLGRAGQAILPGAVRAGVENAVYGVGNAVTEASLNNKALTTEALLSHAGIGLGMGLGLGGAIGGLGFAGKEGLTALSKVLSTADKVDGELGGVMRTIAKASSLSTGIPEEDLIKGFKLAIKDPELLAQAQKNPNQVFKGLAKDLAEASDTMDDAMKAVHESVWGEGKAAQMTVKIPKENLQAIHQTASGKIDDIRSVVGKMQANPTVFAENHGSYRMTKVMGYLDHAEDVIDKARFMPKEQAAGMIYNEMNWLKQRIGRLAKLNHQPGIADGVADTLQDLYENSLLPYLENETLFGKAAIAQKETNAAAHQYFGVAKGYNQHFGFDTHRPDKFNDWLTRVEANPDSIEPLLANIGNSGEKKLALFADKYERSAELLEGFKKHYELSPEQIELVDKALDAAKVAKDKMAKATEQASVVQLVNDIGRNSNKGGLLGDLGLLGGIISGVPGYGIAKAISTASKVVTNPLGTMNMVARFSQMTGALEGGIDSSLSKMLTKTGGQVGKGLERAAPAVIIQSTSQYLGKNPQERRTNFDQKANEIIQAVNNPAKVKDTFSALRETPEIQSQAEAAYLNQMRFLANKIPKLTTTNPLQPNIASRKALVPDGEVVKFGRYLSAIENPLTVLSDLKAGTVTREQMEALKVARPATYRHIQERTIAMVNDMDASGKTLNYEQRCKIASLMGIPADPSTTPEFISFIQGTVYGAPGGQAPAAPAPAPAPAGRQGVSAARLNSIDAERNATAADTIEQGLLG